jgi:hypothetical protein
MFVYVVFIFECVRSVKMSVYDYACIKMSVKMSVKVSVKMSVKMSVESYFGVS